MNKFHLTIRRILWTIFWIVWLLICHVIWQEAQNVDDSASEPEPLLIEIVKKGAPVDVLKFTATDHEALQIHDTICDSEYYESAKLTELGDQRWEIRARRKGE